MHICILKLIIYNKQFKNNRTRLAIKFLIKEIVNNLS